MRRIANMVIAASFLLVQCASTGIISSWKAPQTLNLQNCKIIVVALMPDADTSLQAKMENHLSDDLCNLGYNAASAIELYGLKTFKEQNEEQMLKKLQQQNVNAVLTIVLLNKQKEKYHAPSGMYDVSNQYSYSNFYPYYAAIYGKIYKEGYYVNDTYYFWESSLYDMKDQKLLYSVRTQSFNPSNNSSLAHEYGKLIIQDMLLNNIINVPDKLKR